MNDVGRGGSWLSLRGSDLELNQDPREDRGSEVASRFSLSLVLSTTNIKGLRTLDLGRYLSLPYEETRVAVSKEDLEGSRALVSFGVPSGVETGVTLMVDTSDQGLLLGRGAKSELALLSHVANDFSKGPVYAVKTPMMHYCMLSQGATYYYMWLA
ncbi:hypothetical protein NE237_002948 [Protea cynaroides]|uniref:Uncharacterized protein n=1 Tax=Protea cynaroides TaxID=273540 RepID=A0A9Q0KGH7_9MAGN|nr:hypothetical protein NE237_002948 [Protea cynaroides]